MLLIREGTNRSDWAMRYLILLSLLILGTLLPRAAAAQYRALPFVGVAAGAGTLPQAFLRNCGTSLGARSSSGSVELRAGTQVGWLTVESRTSFQDKLPLAGDDCFSSSPPVHDGGVHTDVAYPFEQGSFTTTTIQLGARLPVPAILVGAGGGWAWSHGLPFAVIGAGYRRGERVRLGVDAELMLFRVPFDRVTREWEQAQVLRTISTEREHEWRTGLALRLAIERVLR